MTLAEYAAALAALPERIQRLPYNEVRIVNAITADRIYVVHPDCEPIYYTDGAWHVMSFRPTIPE
jgi:hypothetical protein